MKSDSICFNEMDGWKFIALFDIQILSIDMQTQGAHIFCLCNRFLFYSKRTLHLTFASTINSDLSLTVYKSMLNKRWITLTAVFVVLLPQKRLFERFWRILSTSFIRNRNRELKILQILLVSAEENGADLSRDWRFMAGWKFAICF